MTARRRMPRVPQMPGNCRLLLPEITGHDWWLQVRGVGIGGSEVAALLGISPYATAFDVFQNKVDEHGRPRHQVDGVETELLDDLMPRTRVVRPELLTDNPIFEWGHRLEQTVATKAADELGLVARTGGGLWQRVDHPVAIVTPDRIATRPRSWRPVGPIECKTAAGDEGWADGSAPLHYQVQLQWQLGILGLDRGWLACLELSASRNFYLVELKFDAEWFDEMVRTAEIFWSQHVLTGEPPMHDLLHPHTEQLLREIHPAVVTPSIELPDEAAEWVEAYHAAKADTDAAKKRLDEAKNGILLHLGDAGAGYIGDTKAVSYPEVRSSRIDVAKLRESYPEVAEQVTVTSTHRRLTVRKPAP
ncbi:MAG: YqaJ viral recombinase family protein [Nocardioidaceae bacterium]